MGTITLTPRFSFHSTLALAAAVLVTAGISPGAQAAGDKGRLRLQLGTINQFAYEAYLGVDTSGKELFAAASLFQPFVLQPKSCLMQWDMSGSYTPLVVLTPAGGATSTLQDPMPGFGPTSLGVYDGPKGTPCYRVGNYPGESLTFALTKFTAGQATYGEAVSPHANAFDRLELDVEVKKDAWLKLTLKVAGAITRTYELRTGMSIVPGQGIDSPDANGVPAVSDPSHRIINCKARSDSGPDSGPNDNCRWIIEDLGQSFTVAANYGEFSLEGGGDWPGAEYDNNSLVYLTSVKEGTLCGENPPTTGPLTIGTGSNDASCEVVQTSSCSSATHYVFRDISGVNNGCEFIKAPGKQFAALTKLVFPPEPRTLLNNVPKTMLVFTDGYGNTSEVFKPDLCYGTVTGTGNGRTIDEVLKAYPNNLPGVSDAEDAIPGNGYIDWACVLEQNVEYLGPLMQVEQTILFWGDLMIIRN